MVFSCLCLVIIALATASETEKRILLEDNNYAIVQRLDALETEMTHVKQENGWITSLLRFLSYK